MSKGEKTKSKGHSTLTEEDKRILYNAAIIRAMPDNIAEALAKARSKPIWCSDTRWRMELARRRNIYI
jgi:hypothetical protein